MALFVYLVLFLALTRRSSALYCLCKDGVGDQALQKAIDYACGAGADCSPILQNGACYQPNTVKDHCNYAVNSYYQRKGNAQGTCDFAGAATTSANPPATSSGCVYPSSPSNAGTTPSTGSPPGTTPGSPTPVGISPTSTTGLSGNGANLGGINSELLLLSVLTMWLAIRV
ncbi:hypothetical protein LR48_Vigan01g129500 [Vigna angularis]|uniref:PLASMODESMATA CALLOSE-BINDING PROTEIN 4 n=2 Tax=Phaseolus angularis TaxID=3914 RepID=A0A0L9TMF4_PHAAN|nr:PLASMODESMATA CALLOSE-BINDING PROTEIN 3 [Vigna angularis]KAG2409312.1 PLASMODESMATA CALLOSE-BINDING PROTEIN 4 [Vigna angularis]KOM31740.1 hypothetical protein LR48_Vigan01g129500 [Vigna angularis]BAT74794.1 hypothetical protein VIGAN_01255400 [Vigna angularis var. angularis]